MIQYGKHNIVETDIEAVCDVLRNHHLTQGAKGLEFEEALCKYTGASHAVTVNSGTSALHIACLALDIGASDLVWTVPNSFVASANCALYCGADIDFVDIDADSRNIDTQALQVKLHQAKQRGRLPKAIIVVHFAGLSCEMKLISESLKPYNIAIIEDASHALGGSFENGLVGSCRYSDFCVFSFHPVKSITTAEGGALMSNNEQLAGRARSFAKHGITRDISSFTQFTGEPWEYEQHNLGFNYRLSDIQAALGISQLQRLNEFILQRTKLAERYQRLLADLPLKLPAIFPHVQSAWHIYVVELQQHDKKYVFNMMREKGVALNVHYIPIHLQPYYRQLGFNAGDFPVAEQYYKMALTLPLYPDLSESEQDFVVASLKEVLV